MRKRHWARQAGALLALALVVGLVGCAAMSSRPSGVVCDRPVYERPTLTDLCGFGGRPASLFAQVGLKGDEFAFLNVWRASVGVPIAEVDTFCVVCLGDSERALLVQSTKDIPQGNVMMACQAGDLMPGKVYTGKSGLAVHFPQSNLALITDSPETMAHCLKNLSMLKGHLKVASGHHCTVWGKGRPFSLKEKQAVVEGDPPALHTSLRVAPPAKGEMNVLGFAPFVMTGVRWGRVTIDVGPTAELKCQFEYADARSAKKGATTLNTLARCARGGMLMIFSQFQLMTNPDFLELSTTVGKDELEFVNAIPADFIVATEKALQSMNMEAKGRQVSAKASIPVVEHLPALGKFLSYADKFPDKVTVRPGLVFEERKTTSPSGRYLAHPPQYHPPSGPLPAEPPLPPSTSAPPQPVGVGVPLSGSGQGQAGVAPLPSPSSMRTPGSGIRCQLPGPPDAPSKAPPSIGQMKRPEGPPDLPPPPQGSFPSMVPAIPPVKSTVTVGNLRSVPAVIFRVEKNGTLTFLHKVAERDATDLHCEKGQNLVAVFTSEPYSVTRTVTEGKQDWVIRPESGPRPTTSASMTPYSYSR